MADYYISSTGNDDIGSGTENSPWATIDRGVSAMCYGDTLVVVEAR